MNRFSTRRRLGWQTMATVSAVLGSFLLAAACSSDPDHAGGPSDSGSLPDAAAPDVMTASDASRDTGAPTEGGSVPSGHVVISQIYGGGGSADAIFTHDFVELFNARSEAVSLRGWSLQYASASGTGNFGATDTQMDELPDVSIEPGQYYLVQLAQGTAGTTPLPSPDFVDPTPINMSATAGKIALVKSAVSLGCNGSSAPCSDDAKAQLVDLVGYGAANFFEGGGPAVATTNATADFRLAGGCIDTDDNASDFSASAPAPRNTQSSRNDCTHVDAG